MQCSITPGTAKLDDIPSSLPAPTRSGFWVFSAWFSPWFFILFFPVLVSNCTRLGLTVLLGRFGPLYSSPGCIGPSAAETYNIDINYRLLCLIKLNHAEDCSLEGVASLEWRWQLHAAAQCQATTCSVSRSPLEHHHKAYIKDAKNRLIT